MIPKNHADQWVRKKKKSCLCDYNPNFCSRSSINVRGYRGASGCRKTRPNCSISFSNYDNKYDNMPWVEHGDTETISEPLFNEIVVRSKEEEVSELIPHDFETLLPSTSRT